MLTITKSFGTSDKAGFVNIEEAKAHELALIIRKDDRPTEAEEAAAMALVIRAEEVIDILKLTPTSRPRARKKGEAKPAKKTAPAKPAVVTT
jgi:hypothetical protein